MVDMAQDISRLHEDLLWLIFMKNTEHPNNNTSEDDRLMTARRTSQVCHSWRELVLRSSSLWGRLIDLNRVNQNTDEWRNEILRRSGNSLLWIHGRLSSRNSNFFFSILERHWTRIQRLNILDDYGISDKNPEGWKILQHAAPYLESIILTLLAVFLQPQSLTSLEILPIFADNAPFLQEYRVPDIKFNPRAPWLSNIRRMTFFIPFTIPEIFEALDIMPLLEFLSVRGNTNRRVINPENTIIRDLPSILLPRLNQLHLRGGIPTCLPFLERVVPAPGCSLSVDMSGSEVLTPGNLAFDDPTLPGTVSKHLGRYLRNYFDTHTATHAALSCIHTTLSFAVDGNYGVNIPYFIIDLNDVFQDRTIPFLSELCASSCLSSIESLDLIIVNRGNDWVSDLLNLLCSLHSVTEIQTSDDLIEFILEHHNPSVVLLPALHTININQTNSVFNSDPDSPYPFGVFLPFMKMRKDAGFPISVFDLQNTPVHQMCDLDFLDDFVGLTVKWVYPQEVERKYVCGSGHPEILRFKSNVKFGESRSQDIGEDAQAVTGDD